MGRTTQVYGKKKIIAHLGNLGLNEALKSQGKMSKSIVEKDKVEIMKKAQNTISLSLSEQIL